MLEHLQKLFFATRFKTFAFWSAILILSALWAVYTDFNPEWKAYQKDFETLTLKKADEKISHENAKVEVQYKARLDDLDRRIRELKDVSRSQNHQKLIDAKKEEIRYLTQDEYEKGQQLAFAKSQLGAVRSRYEFNKNDHFADPEDVKNLQKEYEADFQKVQALTPIADEAYKKLTKGKEDLKELEKGPAELVHDKEKILAEVELWQKEVEKIRPTDMVAFTANKVRDIPLLDFINPKYNLKQIVLDELPDLTKSAKVDRCTTCHLGVTDPAYNGPDVPMVFRAHPNLDLFLSKNSPHPIEKFGCTTCHLGRPYGTTFQLAAHTPANEDQTKEWKGKYGYSLIHDWDYPMLPKKNMEAMCFNCHKTTQELTMARSIFEGRKIYERRGCHGCHKIDGVSDDMKKVGPTLKRIASKLNPEWTPRWIAGPREFYASARMPHPFGHRIPSEKTFPEYVEHFPAGHFDPEYKHMTAEESVMIDAITTWLYDHSDKDFEAQLLDPPAEEGNVENGKKLVGVVNCLGCHKLDVLNAPGQGFAPDLSKIGSKTNRKWLFNWLKDPQKYWPDTNMPNPRLKDDQEANDITAYLLTLKDDEYLAKPKPQANPEMLEEVAIRYKRAKLPEATAKAEVAKLSDHDRKLFVGEETLYRRGCFGCHNVAGFETRSRIGTELTSEGFKELERFDFGIHNYVHIPHARHDWIDEKVKQPFVYFLGKVTNPYEQTFYMPWFGFSEKEAAEITSFVLGQSGKPVPASYRYEPRGDKEAILAGRKLIERRNCQGCHPIGLGWQYIDPTKIGDTKSPLWLTDPLVANYDPNLPEHKFSKISQITEENFKTVKDEKTTATIVLDKVIVPKEGFINKSEQVVFGKDYIGMNDLLGEKPVEVDIGAKDQVKVALERPDKLKAFGVDEGYVAQFYPEAALAPPVLRMEGAKVNPDWFFDFLKNVRTIRNHIEVRMPQFPLTDEEATTLVKYFSAAAREPFPFQTVNISPLAETHKETAKNLFGLPETENFGTTLQCLSCHPTGDYKPNKPKDQWGPDLALAHDRLKPSFIRSWLKDPNAWSPGTKMPNFFYEKDGDIVKEVKGDGQLPQVNQLGVPEAINRLTEMLFHLPEIKEVKEAAAHAAEIQAKRAAEKKAEPDEEFNSDEDAAGANKKPAEEEVKFDN